jgi:spore germination protein
MKKHLKKLGIILTVSTIVVSLLLYIDAVENKKIGEENESVQRLDIKEMDREKEITFIYPEDKDEIEIVEIVEVKEHEIAEAAWIPPWDYTRGVNSIDEKFHTISPVAFSINNDGTLTPRVDSNLTALKTATEGQNIKILPTISNFDWKQMQKILEDANRTQQHINSIVNVVNRYNYDGIDLDYESLSLENKQQFLNFVKNLSSELRKNDKLLSITVLPKWGEHVNYTSLAGTRKTQDWEYIGLYADQVRIMTYDFTSPGGSAAGPIAPIGWVEEVLEYAIEKVPREKIWLGIHLYSYEWVMPTKNIESQPIKTNSYTYDTLTSRVLKVENIHMRYNDDFEEGYADYPCHSSYHCVLYYATPQSVEARKNLAKDYKIAGVVYWRLGGEGNILD